MINNNYSTLIWGCATVRLCLNHNISLVVENDGNRNNINLINLTWFIFNVFSIRKDIFRFFTRSPMPGIWIMETEAKLELLLSGLRHLLPLSLRKKQKKKPATSPKQSTQKEKSKCLGPSSLCPEMRQLYSGLPTKSQEGRGKRIVNANFIITFLCPLSGYH